MNTLQEIYKEMKSKFAQAGLDTPELDAKYLIQAVTGYKEEDYILNREGALSEEHERVLGEYTKRRLNREPVSKILGQKEFWGRLFNVTDDTLDPRPDSETLIQAVLSYVQKNKLEDKEIRIVDLGTGSGCLIITLLAELSKAKGLAVDISEAAMSVAHQNAVLNAVESRFQGKIGSWAEGVDLSKVDIIISNPPYIPESEIRHLSLEVQNHDPVLALVGGGGGLDCYKIIFNSIKNEKKFKGRAFFEIGFDQHSDILRLVDDSMLWHCDSVKDLGGVVRVVEICCGDK